MCVCVLCVLSHTGTHTLTRLTAPCPGLPRWVGTTKVKPIWILLKQETVSGSGISWAICKSAPHSRQITMPAPHYSYWNWTGIDCWFTRAWYFVCDWRCCCAQIQMTRWRWWVTCSPFTVNTLAVFLQSVNPLYRCCSGTDIHSLPVQL